MGTEPLQSCAEHHVATLALRGRSKGGAPEGPCCGMLLELKRPWHPERGGPRRPLRPTQTLEVWPRRLGIAMRTHRDASVEVCAGNRARDRVPIYPRKLTSCFVCPPLPLSQHDH